MQKISVNKILMYLSLFVFCIITIPKMLNHVLWFDEYWDWIITKDMNIHNCVQFMRENGHFMPWYLIVMSFSKFDLFYPYSLLITNWIFYFLAILFMWKKAPFNDFVKIIITFSWISLNYFSIVARCYSIGILLMFILASLYKEQTKKPVLYSLLLVLTAHTSFLAAVVVLPLTLIFIYELLKIENPNKIKIFITPFLILVIGYILWLLPFFDFFNKIPPIDIGISPDIKKLWDFFNNNNNYFLLYLYIISSLFILFYSDIKIRFLFLTIIVEYIIFFSYIYPAFSHLNLFLFVYLIFAYWLTPKLHSFKKLSSIFLIIFSLLLLFNLDKKLEHILKTSVKKTEAVNYINTQSTKGYIFAPIKYTSIIPLIKGFNYNWISDECSENDTCAEKTIKDYLIEQSWYKRAYLFSSNKLNQNSKEFILYDNSDPKKIYVTIFDIK